MKKKIAFLAVAAIASLSAALFVGCGGGESHALVKVEAASPTCVMAGNKEYYKCYDDGCGKIFSDAEGKNEITLESVTISALGHTLTGIGTPSDPTCTDDGITAGEKCSVCGMLVTEQQVITKKGHHATKVDGTAPDCEHDGTITYYACGDCGKNFIDDECVTEAKSLVVKATGHDYSEWTPVGTTCKHQAVCSHDKSHVMTVDCKYGKISDFTDGTGHYLTCEVCGGTTEKLPHELEYFIEGGEHWTECQHCAYVSEKEAHSANELKIEVTGEKLYGGRTLTKDNLAVAMKCVCGHIEDVSLDEITFENTVLVDGDNQLTLTYNEVQYPFTYDAPTEPTFALTVVGATFENGTDTVELKEGMAVPELTLKTGKTFLGYRDGLAVYNDLTEFTMPDKAYKLTALYEEELIHFAPADRAQSNFSEEEYEHVVLENGIIATRLVWSDDRVSKVADHPQMKLPHSGTDTGSHKVNVYSPAHGASLMFIYVVNSSDKDATVVYQAENYGVKGEITIVAKAGETTRVPFVYSLESGDHINFPTCDHRIELVSERAAGEEVTLDFYGKLVSTENNCVTGMTAKLGKTEYAAGEKIDLSTLSVTASISGYSVPLYSEYTTSVAEGVDWTEDIKRIDISAFGFSTYFNLNEQFSNWIHATVPANPNVTTWISAEHITDEATGLPSTRITFKAGAAANSDTYTNPTDDKGNGSDYNTSMPQYVDKTRTIKVFVKNTSNQAIKARLYWENWGDIGGADVDLEAGASGVYDVSITAKGQYGTTTGCRINIKLLSDIGEEDASIEAYTMYKAFDNEVNALAVADDSLHKKTFTVGETFSSSKLKLRISSSPLGSEGNVRIVNNIHTDLDGYTFTEEDIGKHTVKVVWNGVVTTYEINVVAAQTAE